MEAGVDKISSTLENRAAEAAPTEESGLSWWIIALIIFGIFLYIVIAFAARNPFWGVEIVLALVLSGKGGASGGSSFGSGSSGGGGSSSDW